MKSFKSRLRLGLYLLPALASLLFVIHPHAATSINQMNTPSGASTPTLAKLFSFKATAAQGKVLLEWQTGFEVDNLGFNLYREQNGERTLVNPSIIAGSALNAGAGVAMTAGRGYAWIDTRGDAVTSYYLEAIALDGTKVMHGPFVPVQSSALPKQQQSLMLSQLSVPTPNNNFERGAASTLFDNSAGANTSSGDLNTQWAIAAQPALKIQIKKSGWYRVTQPELINAGYNASADAAMLRLYADGIEQAMYVSRSSGTLRQSDYIEFYAQSLSNQFTDTRAYWLVVGDTPGKRMQVFSEVRPDNNDPPHTAPTPQPSPARHGVPPGFNGDIHIPLAGQFFPPILRLPSTRNSSDTSTERAPVKPSDEESGNERPAAAPSSTSATPAESPSPTAVEHPKKKKRAKTRKNSVRNRSAERNHYDVAAASASSDYPYTVEHRNRSNYFTAVLNGDAENFFGEVVLSTLAANITLDASGLDAASPVQGTLEVAIQGVSTTPHQIDVTLNDVKLATMSFFYHDNAVVKIPVSMSMLRAGANTLKLSTSTQGDVTLVDYVRLSYLHTYTASNDSLSYSAKSGQTIRIDGFTSSQIRVIDVTDPNTVQEVLPAVVAQGGGYSILVPARSWSGKGRHTFLAFAKAQAGHVNAITFNQPSQLNTQLPGADLLVLSYGDFIPAVQPLVDLRRNQGLQVALVNVEDVYDEFSYGNHSTYAVQDFLKRAYTNWLKPPHFLLLVGSASYDPKNYYGSTLVDYVPSKLVDATFTEAASDEALADFDGDGLAEIVVGRLPGRSVADINNMVAKIVNYSPSAQAQTAVMVADNNSSGYDFESENSDVAKLLPPSVTVQNINFGGQTIDATRTQIISAVSNGPILVNYSGHGTVDAWTGSHIFQNSDVPQLTNGNRLPIFIMMTCLTGYFNDPFLESMSLTLMRASNGGAVASWSSSGLTIPTGQQLMNKSLYQQLFSSNPPALGDAVRTAKTSTDDIDVRHTWVLFGDPSMKVR